MSSLAFAPLTPAVKRLLILTVGLWVVVQIILDKFMGFHGWRVLVLTPQMVIEKFYLWQLLTYAFFHAISPFHLLFNMLMLWFFGSELERKWGSKFFTWYYLGSAVGAAIIYCLGVAIYAASTGYKPILVTPVLGASGGLFGLLLAYGIIFAEREIYFMGVFPLKAKYFVMIAGAMDLASLVGTGFAGGEVAYLAHLGGIASGFIILRSVSYYKTQQTATKSRKKASNLRLVVDNEKKKDENNPKYWN
ncbi:MAG: rhomboid family intramembrane serine protease [Pseudobdellovibrio sp.]